MKTPLKRHWPDLARRRSLLGSVVLTCAIAGVTAAPAGAVNVFTLDSGADGRAGAAVDNAGNGYFAWEHKDTSTNDVTQFCKVARGGKCTSPIVLSTPPLNPAPFDSTDVSAAFPILGPGSTVYVVGPRFVAGDVVVWTSTDGGRSFGPAVQTTQSGAYAGSDPTNVLLAPAGLLISSHNAGLNFTSLAGGPATTQGADTYATRRPYEHFRFDARSRRRRCVRESCRGVLTAQRQPAGAAGIPRLQRHR